MKDGSEAVATEQNPTVVASSDTTPEIPVSSDPDLPRGMWLSPCYQAERKPSLARVSLRVKCMVLFGNLLVIKVSIEQLSQPSSVPTAEWTDTISRNFPSVRDIRPSALREDREPQILPHRHRLQATTQLA